MQGEYKQFKVTPVEGSRTIWVSVDGYDDEGRAGTKDQPYRSIKYAAAKAKAGDTVMVRPGLYQEWDICLDSGEEGKWLTIKSEQRHKAVVNAMGQGEAFRVHGGGYVIIDGFEATNSKFNIIHVDGRGHHVIIRNFLGHHPGIDGDVIKVNQADYVLIENCDLSHAGKRAHIDGNAYQELIDLLDVNDSVIRNNYLHDTGNMAVYAKGGSRNTILENNIIGNQLVQDVDPIVGIGAWSGSNLFVNGDMYESYDMIIRNNVIFNAKGGGVGVYDSIGGRIYNNTFINVDTAGIFTRAGNGPTKEIRDLEVYNNIFLDTRGKMPTLFMAQRTRPVYDFKHGCNLFWNNGEKIPRTCLYQGADQIADPLEEGSGSRIGDPRLADPYVDPSSTEAHTYQSIQIKFRQKSGSAAAQMGKPVPQMVPYDLEGSPRTGAFDAGAIKVV